LQRLALITSSQFMQDMAIFQAYNTLQFMDHPVGISVVGRFEQELRSEYGLPQGYNEVEVNPWELEPYFEVEINDGSQPGVDDIQAMTQVMQTALSIEGVAPEVFGGLNIPGLFLQWARKAGFEDVHQFVRSSGGGISPQVQPDTIVAQQVQAGNYVPMQEMMNA
jgi:hypothetical protein